MVIAVIAVTMVQPSIDQVIDVITVRNQRMPTPSVSALARDRRARIGILDAHGNHMLVVVSLMWVVQMSVVEIVYMPIVKNAQMPAMLVVNVGMRVVDGMSHGKPPFIRQAFQMRLIL
jgi:hypothetical protein